jgi:FecR protein
MAPGKPQPPHKGDDDLIEWFTVSYRTIYLAVAAVALLVAGWLLVRYVQQSPPTPAPESPKPSLTTARFTSIEGSVRVKAVGTFEWVAATPDTTLRQSDLVRTAGGSSAEIAFFDGTVIQVRPDSLITIEEAMEDPATRRRRVGWHITSGMVNYEKTSAGSTEVSTPTVRVTQGGPGTGSFGVSESGDTDIRVFGGAGAQVRTTAGTTLQLESGRAVTVDSAGKAGPEVALPAAPVLRAPPHQAEITYPDPTKATTPLVWQGVPGSRSYHVMLDYGSSFSRPLVDQKDVRDTSVDLQGLEAGKYYWRVSAVGPRGVEGPFAPASQFTVTKSAPPPATKGPPLSIETVDVRGNIVQVKGRTEPGGRVAVNGQPIQVQGDGSFNEFITLAKTGQQQLVIRATGIDGGITEDKRSIVVTF